MRRSSTSHFLAPLSPPSPSEHEERPSGYQKKLTTEATAAPGRAGRRIWENVEEFHHLGYRYRLQRTPVEERRKSHLAPREAETLELASKGHSRKEIADLLGLAPSTVGVLLHRAALKLGARTRRELLQNYQNQQGPSSEE